MGDIQSSEKISIIHPDDNRVLGYVVKDSLGWQAQTVFGYMISRAVNRFDAEKILRSSADSYLKGQWLYYDADDNDWFSCVLAEVHDNRVFLIRTNSMGIQEPQLYKKYTIKNPSESNLAKAF